MSEQKTENTRVALILAPGDLEALERRASALEFKKTVDYIRSLIEADGVILTPLRRGGYRGGSKKKRVTQK